MIKREGLQSCLGFIKSVFIHLQITEGSAPTADAVRGSWETHT